MKERHPIPVKLRVDPIVFLNEPIPEHMVNVAMGIDIPDKREIVRGDITGELLLLVFIITGSIHDHACSGFIPEQVGVNLEGVEDKFFDSDHAIPLV
jgi:hypothetical protein